MPTHEILTLLLIIISFLISLFGTVVGFGDEIFMVPILVATFHFQQDITVGTAMISLFPSSVISTYFNRKDGNVDFKMVIFLELPTILGVVIGSMLLSDISANRLVILFALMVLLLGLSFLIKWKQKTDRLSVFDRLNKLKPSFIIRNTKNSLFYKASLYMILVFGLLAGTLAGYQLLSKVLGEDTDLTSRGTISTNQGCLA